MATDLVRQRLQLLRLVSICRRPWVFAMFGVELVVALVPAAEALVIGRLIGGVNNGSGLAWMLASFAALLVVGQLGFSILHLVTTDVARQVDGWVRKRARDLVLGSRSLSQLEDPNVQDDLARAADLGQRGSLTRSPGTAVTAQIHLLFRIVGGLAAADVLARYSIPLAATLVMVALVMRAMVRRHFLRLSDAADALAPMQRRAGYWLKLAGGLPVTAASGGMIRVAPCHRRPCVSGSARSA